MVMRISMVLVCILLAGSCAAGEVAAPEVKARVGESSRERGGGTRNAAESIVQVRTQRKGGYQVSVKGRVDPPGASATITSATATVNSFGSGFVMDRDGLILTAAHVVAGADKITVKLSDGSEVEAQLVGYDSCIDAALLRATKARLRPLELGDSDSVHPGDGLTLGRKTGERAYQGTVNVKGMRVEFLAISKGMESIDAGGPVLDRRGRVVGIAAMSYGGVTISHVSQTNMPPPEPETLFVPINAVKDTLRELKMGVKRDMPIDRPL